MSKKEKTCGKCPNAKVNDIGGMCIAYCGELDGQPIIPHNSDSVKDKWLVTYTRVPTFCPRPANRVVKRETPVNHRHWICVEVNKKRATA